MSEREVSDHAFDELQEILKLNYKYICNGSIPPKKEYYDKEAFMYAYFNCFLDATTVRMLDALKRDVKADYKKNLKPQKEESFFDRLKNRKGIALKKSFVYHYYYIWNTLNTGVVKDYLKRYNECVGTDFEYELLAFMTTITGACLGNKKNGKDLLEQTFELIDYQYGWYHLNDNLINERCTIYSYVIDTNTARAEWLLGAASQDQLLNVFITFVDFLYNPDCAKNYFNAPMLVSDIFELPKFVATIKNVQSIVFDYINVLRKL